MGEVLENILSDVLLLLVFVPFLLKQLFFPKKKEEKSIASQKNNTYLDLLE